jgi:hypothetical protein
LKLHHKDDYKKRRQVGYPSVGDQLDVIWKMIKAMDEAGNLPEEVSSMLKDITGVKTKYNKPK